MLRTGLQVLWEKETLVLKDVDLIWILKSESYVWKYLSSSSKYSSLQLGGSITGIGRLRSPCSVRLVFEESWEACEMGKFAFIVPPSDSLPSLLICFLFSCSFCFWEKSWKQLLKFRCVESHQSKQDIFLGELIDKRRRIKFEMVTF